jgi:hypothetical protein
MGAVVGEQAGNCVPDLDHIDEVGLRIDAIEFGRVYQREAGGALTVCAGASKRVIPASQSKMRARPAYFHLREATSQHQAKPALLLPSELHHDDSTPFRIGRTMTTALRIASSYTAHYARARSICPILKRYMFHSFANDA